MSKSVTIPMSEYEDMQNTIKELSKAVNDQTVIIKSKTPTIVLEKDTVRINNELVSYYKLLTSEETLSIINDQAKLIQTAIDDIKQYHNQEIKKSADMIAARQAIFDQHYSSQHKYDCFRSSMQSKLTDVRNNIHNLDDTRNKQVVEDNVGKVFQAVEQLRSIMNTIDKYVLDELSQFKTKH